MGAVKAPLPTVAVLMLLTACQREQEPVHAQRFSLDASRHVPVEPLNSPDTAGAAWSVTKDAPAVLDYLESQVPAKGFLFGEIGLADISIAVFFRNAAWARFTVDAARWPKTAAFVARALDHPALAQLQPFENVQMGASFAGRCDILEEVGAPITPVTMNGITPTWGIAESRPGAG